MVAEGGCCAERGACVTLSRALSRYVSLLLSLLFVLFSTSAMPNFLFSLTFCRLPSGEAVGGSGAGLGTGRGWTSRLSVLNGCDGARSH